MERKNLYTMFFKRFLDVVLSGIALIVLSPLLLIIIFLICIDSKGSPFFLQERLGYKGNIFKIYKFRTMVVGAENIGDGLSIRSKSDSRITKIGSLLRKTSLDELPQLINVFRGDMSLVGPRPPVVYYPYDGYDNYPSDFKKRFDVLPGITGLAQVEIRNSGTWDDRIYIDLRYVDTVSFMEDIKILFMTVFKVLKKENVY